MAFVEDLTPFFADFGEVVTVQSAVARGIFNAASELMLNDMLVTTPSLEVPATVTAAEGGTVVVRGVSYRIRQVLDLPPDGAVRQLVLVRV